MSFLLVVGFLIADISASIWFGKMVGGWMLLLWFVMAKPLTQVPTFWRVYVKDWQGYCLLCQAC